MNIRIVLLFFVCLTFFSCSVYTISPSSLKEQFIGIHLDSLKKTKINNPFVPFTSIRYKSNRVENLTVRDRDGLKVNISNSPALEMRVTLKNKKRYYFYFDTVIITDDSLSGGKSRFLPGLKNKVAFDSIVKIEIQDGRKRYHYKT